MKQLTKRQQIRLKSYLTLAKLLILAASVIAIIVLITSRTSLTRQLYTPEAGTTARQQPAAAAPPAQSASPEISDLPVVDATAWNLRLVRSDLLLPGDFEPELMNIERGEKFDARAGTYLNELIADARAAGYGVYVCSCYRAYETQEIIYWNHINDYQAQGMTFEEAHAATILAVNYPGGSEHQLGLAADILEYENQEMEPWIGGSGLMLWLEQHCAEYGFVIRYPQGKTHITGVEYEPWHLRYVGNAAAKYIMEKGLCLEEFLELYGAYDLSGSDTEAGGDTEAVETGNK